MLTFIFVAHRIDARILAMRDEYLQRLPKALAPRIIQLTPQKGADSAKRLELEAAQIKKHAKGKLVVLAPEGKHYTSEAFSNLCEQWWREDTTVICGSADGVCSELKKQAQLISLSALTLPHALVQVVLGEQLYRAHTIISGHPYHSGH